MKKKCTGCHAKVDIKMMKAHRYEVWRPARRSYVWVDRLLCPACMTQDQMPRYSGDPLHWPKDMNKEEE